MMIILKLNLIQTKYNKTNNKNNIKMNYQCMLAIQKKNKIKIIIINKSRRNKNNKIINNKIYKMNRKGIFKYNKQYSKKQIKCNKMIIIYKLNKLLIERLIVNKIIKLIKKIQPFNNKLFNKHLTINLPISIKILQKI